MVTYMVPKQQQQHMGTYCIVYTCIKYIDSDHSLGRYLGDVVDRQETVLLPQFSLSGSIILLNIQRNDSNIMADGYFSVEKIAH